MGSRLNPVGPNWRDESKEKMLKIFLERRETVYKCAQNLYLYAFTPHIHLYSRNPLTEIGRGDDDDSIERREGDGDERGVMEQDLVEGSVATAAAAALASAATKAKVKPTLSVPSCPVHRNIKREKQEIVILLNRKRLSCMLQ